MTTPPDPRKFRKKPVVIEAFQWWPEMGEVGGVRRISDTLPRKARYLIDGGNVYAEWWVETLEGGHIVSPGDWIITGVKGERYPCKPDIFAATYDPA